MNSSLNLFTQPDILLQLGAGPLHRFVSHFINSDARLASLDPDSPYLLITSVEPASEFLDDLKS